jgi:hypothetical protein
MLRELAKPVTLALCIVSLYAVFATAFLIPENSLAQKICDSLGVLALAGGFALVSGMVFRDATPGPAGQARIAATLPVQLFWWAAGIMAVLFVVSWIVKNYCIFYRDVRF